MVEASVVTDSTSNPWYSVLKTWCSPDVALAYSSLPCDSAKLKMLDSLKSKVLHTLMQDQKHEYVTNQLANSRVVMESPVAMVNHDARAMTTVSTASLFSEEVLRRAVEHEDVAFKCINTHKMRYELIDWGRRKSRDELLKEHSEKSFSYKSRFVDMRRAKNMAVYERFNTLSSDATVTKNGTILNDTKKLRRIQVKDLKLFETCRGCYLQGTLVRYARLLIGLTTLLEDDAGDIIQITIYNVIPPGPENLHLAEKHFPAGAQIRINEPFLKICRDGNRSIRVDDPSDISFINKAKKDIEAIRKEGRQHMDAGQYMLAYEVYYEGVCNISDEVIPLLNNRSQTEIKLEQFDEALLDAAAVLFFEQNDKAHARYTHALNKLTLSDDVINVWANILQKGICPNRRHNRNGSKKTGNGFYETGNYIEAKQEYTSALVHTDICLLLTNISITCIQIGMLQTAISAASACLRISDNFERKQKAYHSMAKSFLLLRQPHLYKHISKYLSNCIVDLYKLFVAVNNIEQIFSSAFDTSDSRDISTSEIDRIYSNSSDLVSDFLQPDTIEHVYIKGKGRGIRATRDIKEGLLLLVDHPIVCMGVDVTKTKMFTRSFNFNKQLAYGIGDVQLVTKLLRLVKYDGLLARKLLCLESKEKGGARLPLVEDLNSFGYRHLSDVIHPFLPQSNRVIGTDISDINESFIEDILTVNTFIHDSFDKHSSCTGSALCLRISLFNHDRDFNCRVLPFGKALVLFTVRAVSKGSELTICYNDQCKWDDVEKP